MKLLDRKLNVVVTAGASGIGRGIAEEFLAEGCRVFVADCDRDKLSEIERTCPQIFAGEVDVSNYDAVSSFFETVGHQVDHIDVLVNCAGIAGPTGALQDISVADWDNTISVNLNGMFYTLKAGLPLLLNSTNPSIINIASNAAFFGFPLRSPYTAAKWAVIGLTKTLAMELGGEGVRVNAICPGSVRGERIDRVIRSEAQARNKSVAEIERSFLKQVSMKKFVEAQDVAHLSVFLASDYGRYICGQAIGIDGHTEGLSHY